MDAKMESFGPTWNWMRRFQHWNLFKSHCDLSYVFKRDGGLKFRLPRIQFDQKFQEEWISAYDSRKHLLTSFLWFERREFLLSLCFLPKNIDFQTLRSHAYWAVSWSILIMRPLFKSLMIHESWSRFYEIGSFFLVWCEHNSNSYTWNYKGKEEDSKVDQIEQFFHSFFRCDNNQWFVPAMLLHWSIGQHF